MCPACMIPSASLYSSICLITKGSLYHSIKKKAVLSKFAALLNTIQKQNNPFHLGIVQGADCNQGVRLGRMYNVTSAPQLPLPALDFFLKTMECTGEGNGTPLQYCCPENPMDGGAWQAAVHGVAKSQTRLSDFTFTFHFHGIGEGNGNPLQCSCLENPVDGEALQAAVHGVAQSRTQLKQLGSNLIYDFSNLRLSSFIF